MLLMLRGAVLLRWSFVCWCQIDK